MIEGENAILLLQFICRAKSLYPLSQSLFTVFCLQGVSMSELPVLSIMTTHSRTASIPRRALTKAAFSFKTLSVTTDSYGSKLSQVPSLPLLSGKSKAGSIGPGSAGNGGNNDLWGHARSRVRPDLSVKKAGKSSLTKTKRC